MAGRARTTTDASAKASTTARASKPASTRSGRGLTSPVSPGGPRRGATTTNWVARCHGRNAAEVSTEEELPAHARTLHGKTLNGGFALTRFKTKEGGEAWLLVKTRDDE